MKKNELTSSRYLIIIISALIVLLIPTLAVNKTVSENIFIFSPAVHLFFKLIIPSVALLLSSFSFSVLLSSFDIKASRNVNKALRILLAVSVYLFSVLSCYLPFIDSEGKNLIIPVLLSALILTSVQIFFSFSKIATSRNKSFYINFSKKYIISSLIIFFTCCLTFIILPKTNSIFALKTASEHYVSKTGKISGYSGIVPISPSCLTPIIFVADYIQEIKRKRINPNFAFAAVIIVELVCLAGVVISGSETMMKAVISLIFGNIVCLISNFKTIKFQK